MKTNLIESSNAKYSLYLLKQILNSFLTIFVFLLLIFLLSVSKEGVALNHNTIISMDTISKNYLALGDSYTIGESVTESERFPVQTVKILRDRGIAINDADIIAATGWTTGDLLNALKVPPPLPAYDIVTLLIGVNNQYQGKNMEEYKKEFSELFHRAVHFAGGSPKHVIVLSIPDYSVTPFASTSDIRRIAQEIDEFNTINKTISISGGAHYIDITPISREARNDHELIANDGLHPSGAQYGRWTGLLSEIFFTIFKNEKR